MKFLLIMLASVFSLYSFEEKTVSNEDTVLNSTDQIPLIGHSVTPDILIVEPDPGIDYKIFIVKPDPTIDYKILKIKWDSTENKEIDIIVPKK